jgi:hypothetical protein
MAFGRRFDFDRYTARYTAHSTWQKAHTLSWGLNRAHGGFCMYEYNRDRAEEGRGKHVKISRRARCSCFVPQYDIHCCISARLICIDGILTGWPKGTVRDIRFFSSTVSKTGYPQL